MPIMAAHGRSDARGAAWLLASLAKECINRPEQAAQRRDALNNTYRLLEAFRTNPFFGMKRPSRSRSASRGGLLMWSPLGERHLEQVRDALERAAMEAYSNFQRDEAVMAVEDTLKKVAYPEKFGEPQTVDLRQADRFFDALMKNLKVG